MATDKSYEDFFNDDKKIEQLELIENYAAFKSTRVGLEQYRKVMKARLMKEF